MFFFRRPKRLRLPQSVTLTESSYLLDGGTTILQAKTESGRECRIRLNQRRSGGLGDPARLPGRLYVDGELVEVRSERESAVVELLKSASIAPEERPPVPAENRISKNALVLGADIQQVLDSTPQENLRRLRDEVVAFVMSEEYVQIAEHGPPDRS